MNFKSNRVSSYLEKNWNLIPIKFRDSQVIIDGSAQLLPMILRSSDIDDIMNNRVSEQAFSVAKIIKEEFSNLLNKDYLDFNKRYIPDQDTYVIGPYICLWFINTDSNLKSEVIHLELLEIESVRMIRRLLGVLHET